MTRVANVDVLGATFDGLANVSHPVGIKFMVAFLNISEQVVFEEPISIVQPGSKLAPRLQQALDFISNNMDDKGTLVLALPDMKFEATYLSGITG